MRAVFSTRTRHPASGAKFLSPFRFPGDEWDGPSPLHHHYLSWRDRYAPPDVRAVLERATPAEVSAYGDVELYLVEHGLIERVHDAGESWGEYLRAETT
jgi:hypothetical protein